MSDVKIQIGQYIQQPQGYKAFIPAAFPSSFANANLSNETLEWLNKSLFSLGKLDGISQLLPDLDFFLLMYLRKEATFSSEIEGTQATMIDAIRRDVADEKTLPKDVINIVKYVDALNRGLDRIPNLPLSTRLIKELHAIVLKDTADEFGKTPGEYRTTQNWVGGATLVTARFVPPPASEIDRCISDLEKFMHSTVQYSPLIKAALIHAQFETIHPFLDGNGRVGRLLIPLYLCHAGLLEKPVLYLSVYLKKHRKQYFDHLTDYHDRGLIDPWLTFFLRGIYQVSESAIETARGINKLREQDLVKVDSLPTKRVHSAKKLYRQLFTNPIVTVAQVTIWTELSRPAANELVSEFVRLGILHQREGKAYGREFEYKDYLKLFTGEL
ncbi:MAG: Fic family protein [Patescibacteria group bacterium]